MIYLYFAQKKIEKYSHFIAKNSVLKLAFLKNHYAMKNYLFQITDFLKLFVEWDESLNERIREFSVEANLTSPENYGHERSLIAIKFQ